ncbi:MAG: IclR family transcriptional regulator [Rhodobacter sp.]|nr:IclR family transcriptional regulator [Rhodobacter sp.]
MNARKAQDGTVGKALGVLDQVADFGRPVRFGELLEQSNYPKATLYRFLQTLTSQRLLAYDSHDQTYRLGVRLVRLAHAAWKHSTLAPVARPYIEALATEVGETIHLAQMDHGQVLFVDKHRTVDQFETMAQTGKVAPGYCTGVGKAILAFMPPEHRQRALLQQAYLKYTPATHTNAESLSAELDEIRKDGIAFDREEHESGIISIAAPILTDGGRVIGALSIATSTSRHSLKSLAAFRTALLATSEKIGVAAEVWQFPT